MMAEVAVEETRTRDAMEKAHAAALAQVAIFKSQIATEFFM